MGLGNFVDQSGVTRLRASGGGSMPFNGGTITQPLEITDPITGDLLHVIGTHTDFVVDGNGKATLTSDSGAEVDLQATGAGNEARLTTSTDAGDGFTADTNTGINMVAAGTELLNCTPSLNLVLFGGAVAEPNSFFIPPGTFALWLDPTPGATVLNIKAKDSDGTVRSAAIPLA